MTFRVLLILLVLSLAACDSGGGGGYDGSDDAGNTESALAPGSVTEKGATLCGVVVDGELVNPPEYTSAEPVTLVRTVDSNVLEISVGGESRLVKLHALGPTTGFTNTAATNLYAKMGANEPLYFFSAGGCTAETVAGDAEVGQVVTESGVSLSEQAVLERIAGVIDSTDSCGAAAIALCYSALTSGEKKSESDTSSKERKQVSDFLWKPSSESAYNPGGLSILLNPCDARVVVNGQEIREYPTGNGRCVTVRSGNSGCDFGTNIKVEIFDKNTGEIIYFGDSPSLTIANGCERVEYEGSGDGGGASSEETVACETMSADVSYAPSDSKCSGNASVTLRGAFLDAFSVQLRLPDGGDRLDEGCAEASCSPYKVQQYIDGDGTKTACFGAPGNANLMSEVAHTSIKMAGDDSDPDRFCIPDPTSAVN